MHFLVCVRCAVGVNSSSSCAFPSRSRGAWYTREIGEEENLKQQNSDCCMAQFSCSVMSDSLWPQGLQHARLPFHHRAPELAQTHIHQVSDAIQPSQHLLSPSPPAFNLSQHQVLPNDSGLHVRWPQYWSFSFSPSNEYSGLISFRVDWLICL